EIGVVIHFGLVRRGNCTAIARRDLRRGRACRQRREGHESGSSDGGALNRQLAHEGSAKSDMTACVSTLHTIRGNTPGLNDPATPRKPMHVPARATGRPSAPPARPASAPLAPEPLAPPHSVPLPSALWLSEHWRLARWPLGG